jgi:hypothetical protein
LRDNYRHCERSEAIQEVRVGTMDCFAPLAMTARRMIPPRIVLVKPLRAAIRTDDEIHPTVTVVM